MRIITSGLVEATERELCLLARQRVVLSPPDATGPTSEPRRELGQETALFGDDEAIFGVHAESCKRCIFHKAREEDCQVR